MFNPRLVYGSLFLFLLLGLIYEWNSGNKEIKLQKSLAVQENQSSEEFEKIGNGSLDIFVDLSDGSVKEAFLYEKEERNGLYKTRLLSYDDLLRFYFKSTISGFESSSGFQVVEKRAGSLVLVAENDKKDVLTKTFMLEGPHVLKITDKVEYASNTIGNITAFKTFYRNKNKSVDYGTSFSRDHLAYSTTEDVFNDEQITSIKGTEEYVGNWIGYSQKHFVVAVFDN